MNSICFAKWCSKFAIIVALACYAPASLSQGPTTLADLDELVSTQQYQQALKLLDRDTSSASDKLEWLRRHAERGHVPVMYELSVRMLGADLNESLEWYARARLARTLDAAECAQPSASYFWRVTLDRNAERVINAGVAHAKEFSQAIEAALAWDAQRDARPSAKWICGSVGSDGALLPQAKGETARAETRESMAAKVKSVSEFYKAVDAGRAVAFRRLQSRIDVPDGLAMTSAGWLDNRRLLFVGRQPNQLATPTRDPIFPNLYLWDTEEDLISVIRTENGIYDVCVDGDKVVFRYAISRRDQVPRLAVGSFPHFTDQLITVDESQRFFRRPDCEPVPNDPHLAHNADVYWLRSEDGFLKRIDGKILLYRPNGTVIPLDVGNEWGVLKGYAAFARSYLLLGGSRDGKTNVVKSSSRARDGDHILLYWLAADGKTTPQEVPYGVWNEAAGRRYTPSRLGVLFTGGWSDDEHNAGFAGLYLFERSGTVRQLAAGPSRVIAVSPNGCRVAYAYASNRALPMTMNVVDVCTKQ